MTLPGGRFLGQQAAVEARPIRAAYPAVPRPFADLEGQRGRERFPARCSTWPRRRHYGPSAASISGRPPMLTRMLSRTYLWDRVPRAGRGLDRLRRGPRRSALLLVVPRPAPPPHDRHVPRDPEVSERTGTLRPRAGEGDHATIGQMDQPLRRIRRATWPCSTPLRTSTQADRQRERDEVLAITVGDLRALADLVRKQGQSHLCVLGGEEKIHEDRSLFEGVRCGWRSRLEA